MALSPASPRTRRRAGESHNGCCSTASKGSETDAARPVESEMEMPSFPGEDIAAQYRRSGAGGTIAAAPRPEGRETVMGWGGRRRCSRFAGLNRWQEKRSGKGGPQKFQTCVGRCQPTSGLTGSARSGFEEILGDRHFRRTRARLPSGIIPIVVSALQRVWGTSNRQIGPAGGGSSDRRPQLIYLSRAASFPVSSGLNRRAQLSRAGNRLSRGSAPNCRCDTWCRAACGCRETTCGVNVDADQFRRHACRCGGDRVDRSEADRQGVRVRIVSRISHELQIGVPSDRKLRLSTDFDADALAYRGWATLTEVSLPGYQQALALFHQALERDPQNLSAQIGIGAYHARMGVQVLDGEPRQASREGAATPSPGAAT